MLKGFQSRRIATSGAVVNLRIGGEGPPVLMLHGYPQTHVIWHRIAPRLAAEFTVVLADLRGYGDSSKPAADPPGSDGHLLYSKRAMAQDQVEVMAALGFDGFAVVGHDRGGRVGHRMALDHPQRVQGLAVLDIVPTLYIYRRTTAAFALDYWHWFFLPQPYPLPERLIGGDPDAYLQRALGKWRADGGFAPEALAEYARCFRDAAAIHASCEDYRAAATIDLAHDEADLGQKIRCPVLALWGLRGVMEKHFDVLATWRERASDVRGEGLDCGHYLAEEAPEATAAALRAFLRDSRP